VFGTRVAETILASGHVRPHKQAGHMIASDPIKSPLNELASRRPSTYDRKRSDQITAQRACKSEAVHIWILVKMHHLQHRFSLLFMSAERVLRCRDRCMLGAQTI
jgi:hypothetical protein